jgi:hypothetical protein
MALIDEFRVGKGVALFDGIMVEWMRYMPVLKVVLGIV